jgi:phage terminase Nu1 subunit (DNA packaging protein)
VSRIKVQAKAAAALGVTAQTLVNWKRQNWWQADWYTEEGYDIEAIKQRPDAEAQSERKELDNESRRMNQEERQMRLKLMQMRVDEKAGQLVSLEQVMEGFESYNSAIVGLVLDMPIRLARLLPEGKLRNEMLNEGDLICRNGLRACADLVKHHFERLGNK